MITWDDKIMKITTWNWVISFFSVLKRYLVFEGGGGKYFISKFTTDISSLVRWWRYGALDFAIYALKLVYANDENVLHLFNSTLR